MTQQSAERSVTISALVVAAVYAYRRLTEGSGPPSSGSKVKQIIGEGTPAPLGAFVTAWGLTFFVISILAEAAPGLGGTFALLVAAGDFLSNTQNVAQDIQTSTDRSKGATATPSTTPSSAPSTPAPTATAAPAPPLSSAASTVAGTHSTIDNSLRNFLANLPNNTNDRIGGGKLDTGPGKPV